MKGIKRRRKLTKRSSSSLSTTQTFALAPPGPLPRLRSSSPHIFRAVLVKNSSLLRAPLNFLLFPNNFLKDFSLSSSLTLIEIPRLSPLRNCLKSNFEEPVTGVHGVEMAKTFCCLDFRENREDLLDPDLGEPGTDRIFRRTFVKSISNAPGIFDTILFCCLLSFLLWFQSVIGRVAQKSSNNFIFRQFFNSTVILGLLGLEFNLLDTKQSCFNLMNPVACCSVSRHTTETQTRLRGGRRSPSFALLQSAFFTSSALSDSTQYWMDLVKHPLLSS